MSYRKDGVLKESDVILPPEEILKKGKTVVIECVENIPCNPCETSCPKDAIRIGDNICDLPRIDYDRCSGCGMCVAVCPGLAVFMLDIYAGDGVADITLPYELLPVPAEGDTVNTLDRYGNPVGRATVMKIIEYKVMKNRKVITLRVPREQAMLVRHFKVD